MIRSTADEAVSVTTPALVLDGVMLGPPPAFGRGLLTNVVDAPGADTLVTNVAIDDGGGGGGGGGGVVVPPHTAWTGPPVTCDSVRSVASGCVQRFSRYRKYSCVHTMSPSA